jgi:SAM-dependent methyltransferase
MHVRNEADVLPEVLDHLALEGLEVHVFDDWSDDGTWELLEDAVRRGTVRGLARFPSDGPTDDCDRVGQLRATEALAAALDVDWVMVHDADEIRRSPWPGVRLVDALGRIDELGYDAAAFTVVDFRFTDEEPEPLPPFEASMRDFELGRRPGHLLQVKAWKRRAGVDLVTTGGHSADFAGRRVFPLKLLLKHYPLRGATHAHRKVFDERAPRWEREKRTHGWHVHYDRYLEEGKVAPWPAASLERWDEPSFLDEHLVERLTGIGLRTPAPGDAVSYRDGSEEALLETVRRAADVSSGSDELMAAIVDWPTRYHLSPQRANLALPLVLPPGTRVLDLGAGTGALARHLGERGCAVTALEGSALRAEIAAERCRDLDGVEVVCGTIEDLDPAAEFDLVCIIGVLEYTPAEIGGGGGPARLLDGAAGHVAEGGALVLAIENQLGLKYLMGGAEDHRGQAWVGLEDYPGPPGPRTWTRRELGEMLAEAGLPHHTWLAPYPDYKLPTAILHERTFERADAATLVDQLVLRPVAFPDHPPVRTGDAVAAHRTFVRAGLGLDVASSLLVVASRDAGPTPWVEDALAWLPAGNRVAPFRCHRVLTPDGWVRVTSHRERSRRGWLEHDPGADRPFVPGVTLGERVDDALRAHDLDALGAVLTMWREHVTGQTTTATSAGSGPYGARPGRLALPPDHLDLNPSNLVDTGDGLVLIDAEWRVDGGVDLELAMLRALWTVASATVTSGIAHPWDPAESVDRVFRRLCAHAAVEPSEDGLARFMEAEVELQQLVAGIAEHHLRADWLNPDRRGLDNRFDEQLARELAHKESERIALAAHAREMEGQRDHLEGLLASAERDRVRLRTVRGWVGLRLARSALGRRIRGR